MARSCLAYIGRSRVAYIGRSRLAYIGRSWVAYIGRSRLAYYRPVNDTYEQVRLQADGCDREATGYGLIGDSRDPGALGRMMPVFLDWPSSWGPAASAQGEWARREAAR